MSKTSPSGYQTTHSVLRTMLRDALSAAVWSRADTEGGARAGGEVGSVPWRACATLFSLLDTHRVDRRGRCRYCRGSRALLRRRHRCQVHQSACHWLHQLDENLLWQMLARLPYPDAASTPDRGDPPAPHHKTPADPSPLPPLNSPGTDRPVPDHGGAGECPHRPRPHRGPPPDPDLPPGRAPLVTGTPA